MSEPKYIVVNNSEEPIAWSKFGVVWGNEQNERLGDFDEENIYDNNHKQVAYFNENKVFSMRHDELGEMSGNDILINGIKVGSCIGNSLAGLSAIALVNGNFNE